MTHNDPRTIQRFNTVNFCGSPSLVSELLEARRRYKNARRRARYASGTPCFNIGLRARETRSIELDLKYELAMADCTNLEIEIERITGKRPAHYDPKREFAAAFSKLMASNAAGEPQPPANQKR